MLIYQDLQGLNCTWDYRISFPNDFLETFPLVPPGSSIQIKLYWFYLTTGRTRKLYGIEWRLWSKNYVILWVFDAVTKQIVMLAIYWNWPFSLHNCRVSCSLEYLELKLGSKSRLHIPELYMVLTVKITMSPMICEFSWNHTKSTKNWNLIGSAVMTLSSYHYQYQYWVNTNFEN